MKMTTKPYSHLKADEKAIAKRFYENIFLAGEYHYDVTLDVPEPVIPAWWTKKDREAWAGWRSKRIDLVIKQKQQHIICEITPKLSKAAIGGVLSYRDMYKKQYRPMVPVNLGIIVEMDDPAYHPTLKKNLIRLWVV